MPSSTYTASTVAEIQAANIAIVAGGMPRELHLDPVVMTVNTLNALEIDHSYVRLVDHGATLDASALPASSSGAVLTFTGSVAPPYYQSRGRHVMPRIVGPGANSNVTAVLLRRPATAGDAGRGPSHIELVGAPIQACGTGIAFSDHAYLALVSRPDISSCGICVDVQNCVDGGENIRLADGALYNSPLALKVSNPDADVFLDGMSLDYNAKMIVMTAGSVDLRNCHIEAGDFTQVPITLSGVGTALKVWGGFRGLTGTGTNGGSFPHWVTGDVDCFYFEEGVRASNDRSSSSAFASGDLTLRRGVNSMYAQVHNNCFLNHATRSRFIDGNFTSMADMAWVEAYTTQGFVQTNRYTESLNGQTVTTIAASSSGLVFTKRVVGPGSTGSFVVTVPVELAGELISGRMRIVKAAGAGTGPLYVTRDFVRIDPVAAGSIPNTVSVGGSIDGTTVNFDSAAYDQTLVFGAQVASQRVRAPASATHMALRFNGGGLSANTTFTVSGFNFDRIG